MTKPIGVQLYSVRQALADQFEPTLRRVAAMGYAGVEFAGVYGQSPASAAALCRELDLQITSAHLPLPLGDARAQTLETAEALGIQTIVCGWLPSERFTALDSIKAVCDELNEADEIARANGLKLAYHNHEFEFQSLPDSTTPHAHMQSLCAPTLLFELDIYWARFAKVDPAAVIRELGARAPLIHVKDGDGIQRSDSMRPLGEGIVDIPTALNAADAAEWLIVELDSCAIDMFEALEKSIAYLQQKGLGHGR